MANIVDIAEILRAEKFPEGFLAVGMNEDSSHLIALYGLTGLNSEGKRRVVEKDVYGRLSEIELKLVNGDKTFFPLIIRGGGMIIGNGEHTKAIEMARNGKSMLESLEGIDYSVYPDKVRISAYLSKNEAVITKVNRDGNGEFVRRSWEFFPLIAGEYHFISASYNEPLKVGLKIDSIVPTAAGAARILYSALVDGKDKEGAGVIAVYVGINDKNILLGKRGWD